MTTVKKSEEEWRAILDPEQFRILREKGTELVLSSTIPCHSVCVYSVFILFCFFWIFGLINDLGFVLVMVRICGEHWLEIFKFLVLWLLAIWLLGVCDMKRGSMCHYVNEQYRLCIQLWSISDKIYLEIKKETNFML